MVNCHSSKWYFAKCDGFSPKHYSLQDADFDGFTAVHSNIPVPFPIWTPTTCSRGLCLSIFSISSSILGYNALMHAWQTLFDVCKKWRTNPRFYVLLCSVSLALIVYAIVAVRFPSGSLRITKLTQTYALLALLYLYLALLISPLYETFTHLPYRSLVYKARRGLGVSTFFFASMHAYNAFFNQLGGFLGLPFLPFKYLEAISFSFTAWCILLVMALTSFDFMVQKLGYAKWKRLHRLVYVAAIFILIHALMLGSHFVHLGSYFFQFVFIAVSFLIILEMLRIDRWLAKRFARFSRTNIVTFVVFALLIGVYAYTGVVSGAGLLLSIHSHHGPRASEGK